MDPVRWVEECSRARGAAFVVIKALRRRAEGCMATTSVRRIITDTRYTDRTIFRALAELEELQEIQRLQWVKDKRLRVYHLKKICDMKNGVLGQGACPQLLELSANCKIPDRPKNDVSQIPLFSAPFANWTPVITDEELRWRANELRARLGLPVLNAGEFALRPC